jgi:hypothetical protein
MRLSSQAQLASFGTLDIYYIKIIHFDRVTVMMNCNIVECYNCCQKLTYQQKNWKGVAPPPPFPQFNVMPRKIWCLLARRHLASNLVIYSSPQIWIRVHVLQPERFENDDVNQWNLKSTTLEPTPRWAIPGVVCLNKQLIIARQLLDSIHQNKVSVFISIQQQQQQ